MDLMELPSKTEENDTWWKKLKVVLGPGFVIGKNLGGRDRDRWLSTATGASNLEWNFIHLNLQLSHILTLGTCKLISKWVPCTRTHATDPTKSLLYVCVPTVKSLLKKQLSLSS